MPLASTYYDSNDTGLGGIANTAGSMITFLDKVLVNGYNSQALTSLTRSGTLVTATLTSHGFRDRQWVTITGASPAEYNGTWQVITGSTSTNTFQFNVTSTPGSSPATGTITCIVAPLGWTKPYSGTNLATYRAPSGNRLYLRVDDTGTTSARVVGYESMTDVNTGTNAFPTAAQLSGGTYWGKSSGVARRTFCWGNQSMFYVWVDYDGTGGTTVGFEGFGDFASWKPGDVWNTIMLGASSATNFEQCYVTTASTATYTCTNYGLGGHYVARSYTAAVGAVNVGKSLDESMTVGNGVNNSNANVIAFGSTSYTNFPFPNPVDGDMWTTPLALFEPSTTPRGLLVGLQAPHHARPLLQYVIWPGTGDLAGKEYLALYTISGGQLLAEISNTW